VVILIESVFVIDMGLNFFKSFVKDGETIPTKDFELIAQRYFSTQFAFDVIPLIPFPGLLGSKMQERATHLYIIKCIRIVNGFKSFNVHRLMGDIRRFQRQRLERIITYDPIRAESKILD
jgi:hypothetical protein